MWKWSASVALLMLLAAASASARSLDEAWKAEGFANPESAVYDPVENIIFVSNIAGEPTKKDGKGFISRVTIDGRIQALEWSSGLDAPKGLAVVGNRLYVADIDQLVAIDTRSGAVIGKWAAAGAKFLNDVAADDKGRVFVSEMLGNQIWMLEGDRFGVWLEDAKLENPNGLKAVGEMLIVASWGVMSPDFSTKVPGHLKVVNVASKEVRALGSSDPAGNLDGVEPDGAGGFYVSDWMAGAVLHAGPDGKPVQVLDLPQGSADIGVVPAEKLLLVPLMMEGRLLAYRMN